MLVLDAKDEKGLMHNLKRFKKAPVADQIQMLQFMTCNKVAEYIRKPFMINLRTLQVSAVFSAVLDFHLKRLNPDFSVSVAEAAKVSVFKLINEIVIDIFTSIRTAELEELFSKKDKAESRIYSNLETFPVGCYKDLVLFFDPEEVDRIFSLNREKITSFNYASLIYNPKLYETLKTRILRENLHLVDTLPDMGELDLSQLNFTALLYLLRFPKSRARVVEYITKCKFRVEDFLAEYWELFDIPALGLRYDQLIRAAGNVVERLVFICKNYKGRFTVHELADKPAELVVEFLSKVEDPGVVIDFMTKTTNVPHEIKDFLLERYAGDSVLAPYLIFYMREVPRGYIEETITPANFMLFIKRFSLSEVFIILHSFVDLQKALAVYREIETLDILNKQVYLTTLNQVDVLGANALLIRTLIVALKKWNAFQSIAVQAIYKLLSAEVWENKVYWDGIGKMMELLGPKHSMDILNSLRGEAMEKLRPDIVANAWEWLEKNPNQKGRYRNVYRFAKGALTTNE